MSRTLRHLLTVVLALTAVVLPVVAATTPAPAPVAAASCSTPWGSTPEVVTQLGRAPLTAVRTGPHGCFDRVVFDLAGPAAGYHVEYVDHVSQDGSGTVLDVPGAARLLVSVGHPAYDDAGNPTIVPAPTAGGQIADVSGYRTLRSVVYGGSFEGATTFGVGVRARLPFRVLTIDIPGAGARLVVDVAHGWS
ncbi:AMIN-like domain-containing (lipo)protein [Pseudonocardia adelaidensis]|uniref:AMIN-like domain-containing protein n=1 Tax=Pseudonocardia adelaidensis TaxID=648754 RepID=A0ABP9NI53_9PSEU